MAKNKDGVDPHQSNQNGAQGGKPNENNEQHGSEVQAEKSAFGSNGVFYAIQAQPGLGEPIGSLRQVFRASTSPANGFAYRIPGVLRIGWKPTFGIASNYSDPVNQAAQALYNDIQDKMNQRNLPFQGGDVLRVLLAMDSIHIVYRFIYRAFMTLGKAEITNDYLPQGLFAAYGLDYADFQSNKAQIREDLATWKAQIEGRYPTPRVFNLFKAHEQMTKFIYADSDSKKAQFYVCTPEVVWSYRLVDTVGQLAGTELIVPSTTATTYATVRSTMQSLIDAVLNSSDFQRIMAAINSTYPDADRVTLPEPGSEVLAFVYDEAFCNCLRNATVFRPATINEGRPSWSGGDVNLITSSFYIQRPINSTATANGALANEIPNLSLDINTLEDTPSSEAMTNYCRWRYTWSYAPANDDYILRSISTEVITYMQIVGLSASNTSFDFGWNNNTTAMQHIQGVFGFETIMDGYDFNDMAMQQSVMAWAARLGMLDAFDAMPMLYVYNQTTSTTALIPIVHWRFSSIIDEGDLRSYHKATLWNAFLER